MDLMNIKFVFWGKKALHADISKVIVLFVCGKMQWGRGELYT